VFGQARLFAALSGPFGPKEALAAALPEGLASDTQAKIAVASHLSLACDTNIAGDGSQWLMRGGERRGIITALFENGGLDKTIAWRKSGPALDSWTQDLLAALKGEGAFALEEIVRQFSASGEAPGERRASLDRIVRVLEWAGPVAPGYASLETIRAAIDRIDDRTRSETVLAHGFFGRGEELRKLRDWLAAPFSAPPLLALFVTGKPGMGKSALAEAAIREATEGERPPLTVRLDFDRSALDVLDQIGLTVETARQIGSQLPDQAGAIREFRRKASGDIGQALKGYGREIVPSELAGALGQAVAASGRSIAMVLDSCEVLYARAGTHPRRLFEWLDSLVSFGVKPMAAVAVGRADTLDSVPDRIGGRISLGELEPDAAKLLPLSVVRAAAGRAGAQAFAQRNLLRPGAAALGASRGIAAQSGTETRAALPGVAQKAVVRPGVQPSLIAREGAAGQVPSPGFSLAQSVKELQLAIERADWLEAADIYDRAVKPARIGALSEAGDAARTLLWRTGRWRQARALLRDLDAASPGDTDLLDLRADDALARLEMRAEFSFSDLRTRLAKEDAWRDQVQKVVARGAKTEMIAGALGFALLCAGVSAQASWRQVNLARAVQELWSGDEARAALNRTLASAQSRIVHRSPQAAAPAPVPAPSSNGAADHEGASFARQLAILSPYAAPAGLLAQLKRRSRLGSHAANALAGLAGLGLPWNSDVADLPLGRSARESVGCLADAGLINEWIGAAAFVCRDADLALIAGRAEAWRRTVAGRWAYGPEPQGWSGAHYAAGLDASLWVRVRELLALQDPVVVSRQLIEAWSGRATAPPGLRRRLDALLIRVESAETSRETVRRALDAALALAGSGLPAAFIPAYATLITFKATNMGGTYEHR
jgi:hypothetical protein